MVTVKSKVVATSFSNKIKRKTRKFSTIGTVKRRVPITSWLPQYKLSTLIQDLIAGITVGLTAIAQCLAYAVLAGLPPERGLYSGMMSGFVYTILGSCKVVSVGPLAMLSALIAPYVTAYNGDIAVLAAFLTGAVALTIGLFNLGFLMQFIISKPVIIGFTNAAAFQVASSQLKPLFGFSGPSGYNFKEFLVNFIKNISTLKLWDTVLGFSTILVLVLLQLLGSNCSTGSKSICKSIRWYFSLSRNAFVVFVGIIVAYIFKSSFNMEPFTLIDKISNGMPEFQSPPFSTTVGNETLSFIDMVSILGPRSLIFPIVAIFEVIAIANAFSEGGSIDASQEIIALGCCNVVVSLFGGMPVTGALSRAAVNYASGGETPAASVFTAGLILLSLSLLTSIFNFIPKAVLAGLIITAMYGLLKLRMLRKLLQNSIVEFGVSIFTTLVSLYFGLDYGLFSGVALQAFVLLYHTSKPIITVTETQEEKPSTVVIQLSESLFYCSVEHIRRKMLRAARNAKPNSLYIIDGSSLGRIDFTVSSALITTVKDLEKKTMDVVLINFNESSKKEITNISPKVADKFKDATNVS